MSPPSSSDDTTNRNDAASNGNVLVRFLPMRSSTSFLVEAQTDANDFTDLEGNHHHHNNNNNSSEAEAGSNEFANVGADSNSSNGHEDGQEVERRVSGGGDGGDPSMDMDLQVDSSSSDTSSHPSNDYQLQDSGKRWRSNPTVLWIFIGLLTFGVVCTTVIIGRKNVVITDLQNKFSSLEKEHLLVTSKPRSQSKQAKNNNKNKHKGSEEKFEKVKGKSNKDECCACLTSSVRLLSNVYTIHFVLCLQCKPQLIFSTILILPG